jgi:hypothetical protein
MVQYTLEQRVFLYDIYTVFIVQVYQTSQYVVSRCGIFLGKWRSSFAGSSGGKMFVQSVCVLNTRYMKYGSARKCWRKFQLEFRDESVPSRQTIHNLVNKLRTGLLIDKKQKHKRRMLTEEKLHDIGTRLEHTPRKSLGLAQLTGVSKFSARRATYLLKLRSYETIVIHALQPRDPASRVNFFAVDFFSLSSKVRSIRS